MNFMLFLGGVGLWGLRVFNEFTKTQTKNMLQQAGFSCLGVSKCPWIPQDICGSVFMYLQLPSISAGCRVHLQLEGASCHGDKGCIYLVGHVIQLLSVCLLGTVWWQNFELLVNLSWFEDCFVHCCWIYKKCDYLSWFVIVLASKLSVLYATG